MAPTQRNASLPFVELPGNGLGDFASEDGDPAPLLEAPARTEVEAAPIEDAVLVMVDAYPDQPHGLVAHAPPPNRHPIRRLVFAIRRAALAVLFAPVLVVAWFLLRIWWIIGLSVTRSWQGVTSAVLWILDAIGAAVDFVLATVAAIGRGIVHAVVAVWTAIVNGVLAVVTGIRDAIGAVLDFVLATVAAIGRGIVHAVVAVWTAIVNAVLTVVTGIRDAIAHAVALVRSAFMAGVRAVLGAAAFVVETVQRAIRATASFALGVCHAVLRLALGVVHATTSSIAAGARRVWRVVTDIRDALVATGAAGVALLARAIRIAATPFVVAARGLGFIAGRSLRTLVVTLSVTGFLAWRGLLLVLGGAAIVTGTLVGLVLVGVYGVRILATTSIALARAIGPASTRVRHAVAAGGTAVGNGVARSVLASISAARAAARLIGAAAVRLAESAFATARQLARAGSARGAAGLAAATAVSTHAVHAAWTGTRATAAYSVREALEQTAALSQVAWRSASRVKARVYHESPVVRVNFAALPGRAGDVRVATTLALVSTAALVLMGAGVALLLTSQKPQPSARPVVAASLLQPVAIPLEPIVAVRSQPEAVAPRPPAPAAAVPAAAPPRVPDPPAAIEPKPAERSTLSAARLRAIWDKSDTRSLDRAIAEMRSATLAFRRCEMRMTSSDAATATCNESASPRVAWTFDFRRNDDRWLIEGVSTTGTPPVAR